MKQNLPEKADEFAMMSDMRYFKAKGDAKNYLKVCNSFIKKEVKNNAAQLHNLAKEISDSFAKDDKAMSQAEKLARQAAETGGLAPYYYTYAIILKQNKKETEALAAAQKSLELAKGSPQEESIAIQLIRALERT